MFACHAVDLHSLSDYDNQKLETVFASIMILAFQTLS